MAVFLHLADLHIGANFDFLPPEVSDKCKNAQFDALEKAVERANSNRAKFILIAGDLFDSPTISKSIFLKTMNILSSFYGKVFISAGNHDYIHPKSPYLTQTIPPNIHVFTNEHLVSYEIGDDIVVWGASFCDKSAEISLFAPIDIDKCNVLCVHAELFVSNSYNALSSDQIAQSGFDYAGFGHNHSFSQIQKAGDTVYSCPGCFSSTATNETGENGYIMGSVAKNSVNVQFIVASTVIFNSISVNISAITNDKDLGRAIAKSIPENPSNNCITLELTGDKLYAPNIPALHDALSQICIFATVQDRTISTLDPWRYEEDDDLPGIVTQVFRKQSDRQADQKPIIDALRIALAAIEADDFPFAL